jgi:hypothetical protein
MAMAGVGVLSGINNIVCEGQATWDVASWEREKVKLTDCPRAVV